MNTDSQTQLDTLTKEFRRMRLVFGLSIAAMAIMLMVVLPSVIRSSVFRVQNDPQSKGLLTYIIEAIRGEPIAPFDVEYTENPSSPDEAEDMQLP